MTKEEIYGYLNERKISYEIINHSPAYTMEDIGNLRLEHPECEAKNLFLRDDKKKNYYILTVKSDTDINLKDFQEKAGTRKLSFASEEDLRNILNLSRGAVNPFGALNNEEKLVKVYLDRYFQDKNIYLHPNDNTSTVYLKASSVFDLIRDYGNVVAYFDF